VKRTDLNNLCSVCFAHPTFLQERKVHEMHLKGIEFMRPFHFVSLFIFVFGLIAAPVIRSGAAAAQELPVQSAKQPAPATGGAQTTAPTTDKSAQNKTSQNKPAPKNPFTLENIMLWLTDKGPMLALVLVAVFGLQLLIRFAAKRIVAFLTKSLADETKGEREKRISTLVGVFHNTTIVVLYIGAVLMVLEVLEIPIGPLLGGVAVAGLAVAFAAQNLIKDYFYGFMILMENQYGVNDVVSIAGITGFVERITLRITVIRDFNAVHFVPHGQITTVSNLTHKWSRAVFDIGVAYKEDVDRVMDVLMQLGRELRQDPKFAPLILADPEMLGVDAFGDSAVVIKFFIKTKPIKQWDVKRELLRRIKKKFDELGIEIPFPHRTVFHRFENSGELQLSGLHK
jgi:small-conductance mechanosensitive channel